MKGVSGTWWVSAPNAAQKISQGKANFSRRGMHSLSTLCAGYHDRMVVGCVPGIPPDRMLAVQGLTHACKFPHNRSGSHSREHTCGEEHRVECCSTLDGKHICILAALQGGARLLKWPAGCPNLRSGFVSRVLMLVGVQKRLFPHNLHFSVHDATRAGQRSHLRLHC